jgi:hypothetical protein
MTINRPEKYSNCSNEHSDTVGEFSAHELLQQKMHRAISTGNL